MHSVPSEKNAKGKHGKEETPGPCAADKCSEHENYSRCFGRNGQDHPSAKINVNISDNSRVYNWQFPIPTCVYYRQVLDIRNEFWVSVRWHYCCEWENVSGGGLFEGVPYEDARPRSAFST